MGSGMRTARTLRLPAESRKTVDRGRGATGAACCEDTASWPAARAESGSRCTTAASIQAARRGIIRRKRIVYCPITGSRQYAMNPSVLRLIAPRFAVYVLLAAVVVLVIPIDAQSPE